MNNLWLFKLLELIFKQTDKSIDVITFFWETEEICTFDFSINNYLKNIFFSDGLKSCLCGFPSLYLLYVYKKTLKTRTQHTVIFQLSKYCNGYKDKSYQFPIDFFSLEVYQVHKRWRRKKILQNSEIKKITFQGYSLSFILA